MGYQINYYIDSIFTREEAISKAKNQAMKYSEVPYKAFTICNLEGNWRVTFQF